MSEYGLEGPNIESAGLVSRQWLGKRGPRESLSISEELLDPSHMNVSCLGYWGCYYRRCCCQLDTMGGLVECGDVPWWARPPYQPLPEIPWSCRLLRILACPVRGTTIHLFRPMKSSRIQDSSSCFLLAERAPYWTTLKKKTRTMAWSTRIQTGLVLGGDCSSANPHSD